MFSWNPMPSINQSAEVSFGSGPFPKDRSQRREVEKNIDKLNGNPLFFGAILLYYSRIFFFKVPSHKGGKKEKNNRESFPPSPRKILFPWRVSAIPISLSSPIFGHLTGVPKAPLKKKVFLNQHISVSLKWQWEMNLGKLSLFFMAKKFKNNREKQESIKQAEGIKKA